MVDEGLLRIGELSRRTGVTPEVLRAWERRYRLFSPARTEGGFRLYSTGDLGRIQAMKRLISEGVSASEAAREVLAGGPVPLEAATVAEPHFETRVSALRDALLAYDEAGAHAAIDKLLMEFDAETVMRSAFLPVLNEIGLLWQEQRITVAEEHFASGVIRRRLSGLTRGWEEGVGPRALLACPPDEEHDIPLLMFGIALGHLGWRVTYLGARTPENDLLLAADALRPSIAVLASPRSEAFEAMAPSLRRLAGTVRIAIGGAGATERIADEVGATLLRQDPVTAAAEVAALGIHGRLRR
jgi:DNA-binding transcriptional MerR regulator